MRSLIPRTWDAPGSFFGDLSDLHRGLDALFEGVFEPTGRKREERGGWWPHVEAHRADGNLVVRCDLPGIEPKDVEVSLEGDTLTITGERRAEKHEAERYSEVRYGRFERTLRLPEGLDPEKVTARYTNGVLEVTVPLPKETAARKIPVETAQVEGPSPKKAA